MVMMEKDGKREFVADVHINSFIKKGYAVVGGVAPKSKAPVAEEKPKKPKKAKPE